MTANLRGFKVELKQGDEGFKIGEQLRGDVEKSNLGCKAHPNNRHNSLCTGEKGQQVKLILTLMIKRELNKNHMFNFYGDCFLLRLLTGNLNRLVI